jgi:pantothenate kinase
MSEEKKQETINEEKIKFHSNSFGEWALVKNNKVFRVSFPSSATLEEVKEVLEPLISLLDQNIKAKNNKKLEEEKKEEAKQNEKNSQES